MSLTTFSCLTNTVIRRKEPVPFLFASFLYIRLILKASLRLTWAVSHRTGRSSSFQIPQILPVLQPFGKLLGLGHVALGVARRLFPFLHGFNTCSRAEVPLEPRYRFDTPGEGAAVLMAPGMEAVKESARRVPVSRLQRIGSQPVSSATRAGERDRLWAELWSTTRKKSTRWC